MEKIMLSQILHTPNWRWIVTAFCFFALFHLLLFFFSGSISVLYSSNLLSRAAIVSLFAFISMFWSRAVIVFSFLAFISMYVGYRARGLVLFESAIAAVLYILTLKILLPSYLAVPTYLQNIYFTIECIILGFAFAFGGAGIGFWINRKYQIR